MVKKICLLELIKLIEDETISNKYINYRCGFENNHQYRHDEVVAIASFIKFLGLTTKQADGFLYSYLIPQLNKEFDLLKISEEYCINIEIKTDSPGLDKIKKQLTSNKHYLKILGKKFCYIHMYHIRKLYIN